MASLDYCLFSFVRIENCVFRTWKLNTLIFERLETPTDNSRQLGGSTKLPSWNKSAYWTSLLIILVSSKRNYHCEFQEGNETSWTDILSFESSISTQLDLFTVIVMQYASPIVFYNRLHFQFLPVTVFHRSRMWPYFWSFWSYKFLII